MFMLDTQLQSITKSDPVQSFSRIFEYNLRNQSGFTEHRLRNTELSHFGSKQSDIRD